MNELSPQERAELEARAKEIRILTIDAIGYLGVGHIGGALSVVEVLTVLYYRHLRHDPARPRWPERDRLVLSKGHAGPALYSTLASRGFFPVEWLHTLNQGGTRLPSHCDRNRTPGIDMTTGSLGQGLSAACGIALANRLDGIDCHVYAIIGDGESDEGQVWEAAMFAAKHRLTRPHRLHGQEQAADRRTDGRGDGPRPARGQVGGLRVEHDPGRRPRRGGDRPGHLRCQDRGAGPR